MKNKTLFRKHLHLTNFYNQNRLFLKDLLYIEQYVKMFDY